MKRRLTRSFSIGNVAVGGSAPVSVQSMVNTDTSDVEATTRQIGELARCGCDLIRIAVPDQPAVKALPQILGNSPLPVIADIHFDYRLALHAIEAGVHGIRINPGTIGATSRVLEVASAASANGVPIRVGVNAGSLESGLHEHGRRGLPEALAESALRHCELLERAGCHKLKVSLKASDVPATVAAYRIFAEKTDYPLHLGVTEAGALERGTIKSAVAIGCLLLEGIGDTLRVSLTAPPAEEVRVAIRILQAVGLREARPDVVSCPTCGRTKIELLPIVEAVEDEIRRIEADGGRIGLRKIAIMGCEVNGPGEARGADVGIAGGKGRGVLFKRGTVVKTLSEDKLLDALLKELRASTARA